MITDDTVFTKKSAAKRQKYEVYRWYPSESVQNLNKKRFTLLNDSALKL